MIDAEDEIDETIPKPKSSRNMTSDILGRVECVTIADLRLTL